MGTFGMGYIPDPTDYRDYHWSQVFGAAPVELPTNRVYDRALMGPVLDQGMTSMCVCFSMATVKMEQEYQEVNQMGDFDHDELYARCKESDGLPGVDGTLIRAAAKIMAERGMYGKVPATADPALYKISSYIRLTDLTHIKQALVMDGPVAFGIAIDMGLETCKIDHMPDPTGSPGGGHCMVIAGFDDTKFFPGWKEKGGFLIKNSWGMSWGDSGYAWMPYTWFNTYTGWDAWKVLDIANVKETTGCGT